ncbi:MAG: AAA family ATPase [Pseudomonadota bacterium]
MRLRRLELVRYGRFTNAAIDLGEAVPERPDLHILFGPNESGKSTAFNAWLDLLFGMRERHPYAFRHEWRTMRVAAVLEAEGRQHRFARIGARVRDLVGEDDRPADPLALTSLLQGVDRERYRLMLSLDEESLRRGGEAILASEGELGHLLFSAAAGLSEVTAVLRATGEKAAEFHEPRKRKTELAAQKAQLAELKAAQKTHDTQFSEYRWLSAVFADADEAYDAARAAHEAAAAEERRLARLADAHQDAARLRAAEVALEPFANAPILPPGLREEVDGLRSDRAAQARALQIAEDAAADLRRLRDGIEHDPAIFGEAAAIRALAESGAVAAKAAADLPKRQEELRFAADGVAARLSAMGAPEGAAPQDLIPAAAMLDRLDQLAAAEPGLLQTVETAAAEQAGAETALREAETAAGRFGLPGSADAAPPDPNGLAGLRARLRAADPVGALRSASSALEAAERKLRAAVVALRPWQGDVAALATDRFPDADTLKAWEVEAAAIVEAENAGALDAAAVAAAETTAATARAAAEAADARARRREAEALARLTPFAADAAALAAQRPPDAAAATAWDAKARSLDEEAREIAGRAARHLEQAAAAAAEVRAIAAEPGLVLDAALAEARAARDAAWADHAEALDAESARTFHERLADHDALVDRRLAGAERQAALQAAERREAAAAAAAEAAEEAAEANRAASEALRAELAPVFAALGLPRETGAGSLPGWLAERRAVIAALGVEAEECASARAAADEAERARAVAAGALGAATEALAARRKRHTDAIADTLARAGLAGEMTLAALRDWLGRRQAALDRTVERDDAAAGYSLAEEEARAASGEIRAALLADGAEPPEDASLPRLLDLLDARVDWRAAEGKAAEAARERLEKAREACDRRAEATDAAKRALAGWVEEWAEATSAHWFAGDDAASFRARLPHLRALPGEAAGQTALAHRIAQMTADIGAHEKALEEVRARLRAAAAADRDERNGKASLTRMSGEEGAGAEALAARLAAAEEMERRHEDLTRQGEAQAGKAADARRHLAAIDRRVGEIAARFPVPPPGLDTIASPEDLSVALARSEEKARLAAAVTEAERALLAALGAADRGAAEAMLEAEDAESLAARREAAAVALAEAAEAREQRLIARRDAERDLEAIGGDDRAAQLATGRQTLLLEIEEGARRAIAAQLGVMAAERALALYRKRHRGEMLAESAAAFRTMTLGSFDDLATQPDGKGGERLIALRADPAGDFDGGGPASIEVSGLTTGTRAQLYLALRVAAYRRFCEVAEPLPFVADDILETFDDDRASAAFRLMAEMGAAGQVLYFTHHRHLCALAEEALGNSVQVHRMPD